MRTRSFVAMITSLLLIAVLVLFFADPWSTLRNDAKRITLEDPGSVDRILIGDRHDSTLLIRINGDWMLDGTEKVNAVAVENLLFTTARFQVNSVVSESPDAVPTVHRKIRFYRGAKMVRSYTLKAIGERYLVSPEGSDRSYVVSVAGYPGMKLEKVFSSASDHYREHLLVELLPSEISLIEVVPAGGGAFRFTQDPEGAISWVPLDQDAPGDPGTPDDLSIRLLFSYFTAIRYEERSGIAASELTSPGSAGSRLAAVRVASHGGEEHTLQVFPYREEPGAAPHRFRALVVYDNEAEALVVKYIYLDVLMRGLSHYFTR